MNWIREETKGLEQKIEEANELAKKQANDKESEVSNGQIWEILGWKSQKRGISERILKIKHIIQ